VSNWAAHLRPPGLVVNALKGDAAEERAHRWLEWDGNSRPTAAVLGVPFDGASVVRTGSRHGPDAVRLAMGNYTTYATSTGATIQGAGAAFSPALGGWIAEWIGFSPTFLVLGALGLLAATVWIVLGAAVKQY